MREVIVGGDKLYPAKSFTQKDDPQNEREGK